MPSMMLPVLTRPASSGSLEKSPVSTIEITVFGYLSLKSFRYPARRASPPEGLCGHPQGSTYPTTPPV
jgi:hypothetical protein